MNPFRPTRWEHHKDGQQLIWYSELADDLAAEKSIYVSGSRGSGKTTLLKSICWEDLARNTSLRMQRTLADVKNISCYIRFPDHLNAALGAIDWARIYPDAPSPDLELHRYFSLLVELTCAERAIEASHALRVSELAVIEAHEEIAFPDLFLSEFPKLKAFSEYEGSKIRSLQESCRLLRAVAREMNQAAGRGTARQMNEQLPPREPGELLAFVAKHLANIVKLKGRDGLREPGFKFCLDDCEVLNMPQQVSINTLVRTCKFPVSWVVSYVGSQFENSRTYLEEQPLTDADRRVLSLDSRSDKTFRELCQSVVSLRLLFNVSEEVRNRRETPTIKDFFPLESRLGPRDVNDMMAQMAKRSKSPIAEGLRRSVENLRAILPDAFSNLGSSLKEMPYYETYVMLHWQPNARAFKTTFGAVDELQLLSRVKSLTATSDAPWLRHKQRAAFLHFAATLGWKTLPLAGTNVILSLADGSIRDFLEILGFIWEAYARRHRLDISDPQSIERFATSRTQIGYAIQTDGVYNASYAFHAGVSARAQKDFDVVLRLIEGLGHYTSILQSEPSDPSVFGRPERGIYYIRFEARNVDSLDQAAAREKVIWNTVRQAELAGYIRTVDPSTSETLDNESPTGGTLLVRLHRRFSPYFRFSFRGPYEVTTIRASSLWQLCDRTNPIKPKSWAEMMAGSSSYQQGEFPLRWFPADE